MLTGVPDRKEMLQSIRRRRMAVCGITDNIEGKAGFPYGTGESAFFDRRRSDRPRRPSGNLRDGGVLGSWPSGVQPCRNRAWTLRTGMRDFRRRRCVSPAEVRGGRGQKADKALDSGRETGIKRKDRVIL